MIERTRYWVRRTSADGADVQLWCINTGKARALTVYRRERRAAAPGELVEWGREGYLATREEAPD